MMPHKPALKPGETVDRYLARVKSEHAGDGDSPPGGIEGTPIVVNGQTIGWNIGGEFFTQEEVDALIATGKFPEDPTTGTGGAGRTQFPSERTLDLAQAQATLKQAEAALQNAQTSRDQLAIQRASLNAEIAATKQRLQEIELEADLAFKNEDRLLTKRLDAEREMLQLRLDNDTRTLIATETGAERRALIAEQGETRRLAAQLQGIDPSREQALLTGQATRGRTPAQLFGQQNQAFLNQPLPTVDLSAPLQQLQQQFLQNQQQRPQQPLAPPGLAQGGVIEMEKKDGAFSIKSFLVGDGAGIIPGVTEVLTIGDGKVTVSPLMGGFQEGGTVSLDTTLRSLLTQFGLDPNVINRLVEGRSTDDQLRILQSLSEDPRFNISQDDVDLYRQTIESFGAPVPSPTPTPTPGPSPDVLNALQRIAPAFAGLTEFVPRTQAGPFGGLQAMRDFFSFGGQNLVQDPFSGQFRPFLPGLPEGANPQALSNAPTSFGAPVANQGAFNLQNLASLGFDPSLLRLGGQEDIFYRDPATGELRQFGTPDIFEQSGFDPADVFNISPTGQNFQFGQPITSPLPLPVEEGNVGAFGIPLIDPNTGALLADPRKIASNLQQLQLEQPTTFSNILSAYSLAGLQPEAFINRFQGATPTGAFSNPTRIGFTGRAF